ncbi:hypothetical protein J1614_012160 [Plenodomus biglobosus]|nr:hypothetical protein J1614_012160 [Plenodomus biglobosus]
MQSPTHVTILAMVILSSSNREIQDYGCFQLITPPPTPNKRGARTLHQSMQNPCTQQHLKMGAIPAPPLTKESLVHNRPSKARKGEGKRLRKAEKNREKRAAGLLKKCYTTQAAKSFECQGPTTGPQREMMQNEKVAASKTSPDYLPRYATISEPEMHHDDQELAKSGGDEDVQILGLDESDKRMVGDDMTELSDGNTYISRQAPAAKNLHHNKINDKFPAIQIQSFDSVPYPQLQPSTPGDHVVMTTALNLLLTLRNEQTTLNARSADIETQICQLKSTKFKLDCVAIAKLEDEFALTVGLSFDMFIAEWAFRDLLELNRENMGFDLVKAMGEMAMEVEALIESFESAMQAWEVY